MQSSSGTSPAHAGHVFADSIQKLAQDKDWTEDLINRIFLVIGRFIVWLWLDDNWSRQMYVAIIQGAGATTQMLVFLGLFYLYAVACLFNLVYKQVENDLRRQRAASVWESLISPVRLARRSMWHIHLFVSSHRTPFGWTRTTATLARSLSTLLHTRDCDSQLSPLKMKDSTVKSRSYAKKITKHGRLNNSTHYLPSLRACVIKPIAMTICIHLQKVAKARKASAQ